MFVKLLVFVLVAQAAAREDVSPVPWDEVQDLKDLLMASVQNTISLNTLVTAQTQKISDLMIDVSSNKIQMLNLNVKYSEALDKIAQLEAKDQELEAEVQQLEAEVQQLEAKDQQLEALTDELRADLELVENPVTIVSGEEANGDPRCAKVCSGTTGRSTTAWSGYHVDVDISSCGFVKIPTITTSLEGSAYHWHVTGTSTVFYATTTRFTMNVGGNDRTDYVGLYAAGKKWNVEWIAVGFTC